ncbi:MAG: DUF3305 domain-containing protein [Gammaproteobacteria bacterium]|nr:DUF3305 domain-containing protein [Gammaproteobacteria bacterium]
METLEMDDFDQALPASLAIAVVMEKQPSTHPWADFRYDAIGVVVRDDDTEASVSCIYQDAEKEHYLVSGLTLRLHLDECESYYHNLMSPEPGCFIVASQPDNSDDMPLPYLVSLSFDEVHAYLEGDEQIYSVPIPQQLYQWAEAFVLQNYVAIKKTKRKLKNWHETEKPGTPRAGQS